MPKGPLLEDQDELFVEVLLTFVERWRHRSQRRIWEDVGDFVNTVLKGLFG